MEDGREMEKEWETGEGSSGQTKNSMLSYYCRPYRGGIRSSLRCRQRYKGCPYLTAVCGWGDTSELTPRIRDPLACDGRHSI